MKKILALAVGMLLIPFTAFGMQMMSDSDMDSITGQSGVAISLDNIQIYSDSGGTELWYETGVAAVGIVYGESPSYLFLNKIARPGSLGSVNTNDVYGDYVGAVNNVMLRGNYEPLSATGALAEGLWGKGRRVNPSVLSIRVAPTNASGVFSGALDNATFTGGEGSGYGAYIEIGLPTIEIYGAEGSYDSMQIFVVNALGYGGADTTIPVGTRGDRYSLGTIYTTDAGSTTAILGGRLGITSLGQVPQLATSSGLQDDLSEGAAFTTTPETALP